MELVVCRALIVVLLDFKCFQCRNPTNEAHETFRNVSRVWVEIFLCIWVPQVSEEPKWKLLLHWEMLELWWSTGFPLTFIKYIFTARK